MKIYYLVAKGDTNSNMTFISRYSLTEQKDNGDGGNGV